MNDVTKNKRCSSCKEEKDVSEFPKNKGTSSGLNAQCRVCSSKKHAIYYRMNKSKIQDSHRRWRLNNPETHRARGRRWTRKNPEKAKAMYVRSDHGISMDEFQKMHDSQKGLCKVCSKPERAIYRGKTRSLCIDHNHKTGKIRGLLCHRCNVALGLLEDDFRIVESLLEYIKNDTPNSLASISGTVSS